MSDEFETGSGPIPTTVETTAGIDEGTPLTPSEAKDKKQMDDYQKKAEAERLEKAAKGEPTTD
jgi:hypothetical protein